MVDVNGDGFNDLIAAFVDGTTKVYLNPGGSNDFAAVLPIEIKAPDPDSTSPVTTDVVVADVNDDGKPSPKLTPTPTLTPAPAPTRTPSPSPSP